MSSIFFGIVKVLDRKGLERSVFLVGLLYSLSVGPPILFAFSIINGDLFVNHSYDLWVLANSAFSGVVGFGLGGICLFGSIRILGATRASVMSATQIVFATALSTIFLGENLGLQLVAGIFLVFLGLIFVSLSCPQVKEEKLSGGRRHMTGILLGLASGFFWGASMIPQKEAMRSLGSAPIASLLSYLFSILALILILVFFPSKRSFRIDKASSTFFMSSGILRTFGSLSRYFALSLAPVVLNAPFLSLAPLITLLLSYMFMQRYELVNARALLGSLLVVVGCSLVTVAG